MPFEGVAMLCEGGAMVYRVYVIRCAMLWGGSNGLWGVQCSI